MVNYYHLCGFRKTSQCLYAVWESFFFCLLLSSWNAYNRLLKKIVPLLNDNQKSVTGSNCKKRVTLLIPKRTFESTHTQKKRRTWHRLPRCQVTSKSPERSVGGVTHEANAEENWPYLRPGKGSRIAYRSSVGVRRSWATERKPRWITSYYTVDFTFIHIIYIYIFYKRL